MKVLVLIAATLSLMACKLTDAIDSVNAVPEKLERTNERLDDTQEAIRLQKLAIAKQNVEDAANAEILIPVPTGLIGYAKLFAETATVEELVGQVYLYIKEVNEGTLLPNWGKAGPIDFTDAELQEFNYRKLARVTAAQAIAAFIPDAELEQMVKEEIVNDGRYRKTALNILMLRFQFLRNVMLSGSLLSEPFSGTGAVEDAVEYLEDMNQILAYSFVDHIGVKITGLAAPLENSNEFVKTQGKAELSGLINTTRNMAKDLAKATPMDLTGDPVKDKALRDENNRRLETCFKKLDEMGAKLP
jgi:hypothetical protein